MRINRRSLFAVGALFPLVGLQTRLAHSAEQAAPETADYTLRIATGLAELAPEHIVSTTLYNGQFPGPLLRFKASARSSRSTTTPPRSLFYVRDQSGQ